MGHKLRIAVVAVAAIGSMAIVGSARAVTVTIGSPMTGTASSGTVGSVATLSNQAFAQPGGVIAAPSDGTIVGWRVRASNGTFTPRVLRPSGPGYLGAGTGAPQSVAAADISGLVPTSLPVRAGDLFGLDAAGGSDIGVVASPFAAFLYWVPPLGDGAVLAPTAGPGASLELNADLRYCVVPKIKGRSPKRARKALTRADCRPGKFRKTKKVTKRKRVLSQTPKPGTAIADTAPVGAKISRTG